MIESDFKSRGFIAVIAAAVGSAVLAFAITLIMGAVSPGGTGKGITGPLDIAVIGAVVLIWAPAFALIPSALLGWVVERPLSRKLIARRGGGFAGHMLAVMVGALLLWLLLRLVVIVTGPQTRIVDSLSLVIFAIIGFCSALSWWFLVILPGRRA